jgi:hypothetical protein
MVCDVSVLHALSSAEVHAQAVILSRRQGETVKDREKRQIEGQYEIVVTYMFEGHVHGLDQCLLRNHSAELSHNFKVSDRRRSTPTSGQNRSESLCAGLSAPCRVFSASSGPVLGSIPARSRRFPAGSLKVFGA